MRFLAIHSSIQSGVGHRRITRWSAGDLDIGPLRSRLAVFRTTPAGTIRSYSPPIARTGITDRQEDASAGAVSVSEPENRFAYARPDSHTYEESANNSRAVSWFARWRAIVETVASQRDKVGATRMSARAADLVVTLPVV